MTITTANLKTPGVYINEVQTLPPSVAQVSTAIPVILGYTQKGPSEATRINSLREYETIFGTGYSYQYNLNTGEPLQNSSNIDFPAFNTFFLFEAMRAYFLNGGGPCYIISVGKHPTDAQSSYIDPTYFTAGLELIDKLDEPTLILFPEAINLNLGEYGLIASNALNIAQKLKDKFVILDSPVGFDLTDSNDQSDYRGAIGASSYGASYFPHLESSFNYDVSGSSTYTNVTLDTLNTNNSASYGEAQLIAKNTSKSTLPPSSFLAGIYAKTDRKYGVWKAPANVAVQGISQPTIAISHEDQQNMNIDPNTGKSINAIRTFAGKGTLVWGARTLDGNSNEWRFIQVRRLFMTVEESIQKAIMPFVFENNNAKTWALVQSMISAYLDQLWKDGALMGAKSEDAYFVNVGLDTTMTEQDILDGRMNVKIGIAAVRPAEFIVLEFSHYLNQ